MFKDLRLSSLETLPLRLRLTVRKEVGVVVPVQNPPSARVRAAMSAHGSEPALQEKHVPSSAMVLFTESHSLHQMGLVKMNHCLFTLCKPDLKKLCEDVLFAFQTKPL